MNKVSTICIINDDDIFTFILKKSITKLNICNEVISFINGDEAIKEFEKPNSSIPNIILLDINMPVLNGWDFLTEFVKINIPFKVDIYLISAHISNEDLIKAKNQKEITGILTDPTDSKILTEIVESYTSNNKKGSL
jgi:response regulator of citrate/malate metabolism